MSRPVFINGRFTAQPMSGVQRFATEIVRQLDADAPPSIRFELLVPPNARRTLHLKRIKTRQVGEFTGIAWENRDLPSAAYRGLLVNLGNSGPLLHRRQLVTIHDASVYRIPENFSRAFRLWYKLSLPVLARRSLRVLTVSQFSRGELASCLRVPQERFEVLYNGVDHMRAVRSEPEVLARLGVDPRRYVLCIGSQIRNKNHAAVLAAMRGLAGAPLTLVCVGSANRAIFSGGDCAASANIIGAGTVTDSELKALYENALCFVFPSLYEGFGIPPVEAMAAGCPVIVSDAAAMPEVCADAALYCDPHAPDTLREHIEALRADAGLRESLIARGLARAAEFTWARSTRTLLDLVQSHAD